MSLATDNPGQALYALFHTAAVDPSTWTKPLDYDAPLSTIDDGSAAYLRWNVRRLRHRRDRALTIAVIPACEVGHDVPELVRCLATHAVPPDLIVVAATDVVEEQECTTIGREAVVFVVGCGEASPASAVNAALEVVVPELADHDSIMLTPAGTQPSANFLSDARAVLRDRQHVGSVGGEYHLRDNDAWVPTLQRMECRRYALATAHCSQRTSAFAESCAVFTVESLRQVKSARTHGEALPPGDSYCDEESLRADSELLMALAALGYACPCRATIRTLADAQLSLTQLTSERRRSYRGMLHNAQAYRQFASVPLRSSFIAQHAGVVATLLPTVVNFAVLITLLAVSGLSLSVIAVAAVVGTLIVHTERVANVWPLGWRARALAAAGVDIVYAVYLAGLYCVCRVEFAVASTARHRRPRRSLR